jgi:hypothetical protein
MLRRSACALLLACLAACSSSTAPGVEPDAAGDAVVDAEGDAQADAVTDATAGEAATDAALDAYDAFPEVYLGDGPPLDDAAPAGACTAILNDAKPIIKQQVASAMPAAKGGTIVEGLYERVAWTSYTGPGGATGETDRAIGWFSGGRFQIVSTASNPERYTGTYATAGTGITLTMTCPNAATSPYTAYTANATTIVLYAPTLGLSLTWQRR